MALRGRKTKLRIVLSNEEFDELGRLARSTSSPAGLVRRANLLLAIARGESLVGAGREVGMTQRHVRKWCERFVAAPPNKRIESLKDLPGRGKWPRFPPSGSGDGASQRCEDGVRAA